MTTYAWNPPPSSCVRRAWLTLGALSMPLENAAGGWFCSSLDLGYPTVRAVVNNRPDDDGIDDRTQFFGERTVTVAVTALVGAGARIDDVADNFAPFMLPTVRPVLHFVLDRPGVAERTITLRPAGYAWKVEGDNQRDIQLQFVAPDPYIYDPNTKTVIVWAGSAASAGRLYPLTFNRVYPAGSSSGTLGNIIPGGDVGVQPLYRIYGPIQAPRVQLQLPTGPWIYGPSFASGFTLTAGQWVDVDSNAKTAYRQGDPTQSVFPQLNFGLTTWPVLPPGQTTYVQLSGTGTTNSVTQVQVIWNDAYLT